MRNLPGNGRPISSNGTSTGSGKSHFRYCVDRSFFFVFWLGRMLLVTNIERERRHALHLKLEKRRKWDHAHRCQFQYGTLKMTVPELAEPGTRNGTTHIDAISSTGPKK